MLDIIREIEMSLELGNRLKTAPDVGLKIYFGCGTTRQPGYINVDVRKTHATDLVTKLKPISRCLKGYCSEVYMSHVLEHFGSPGKAMRKRDNDVLGSILLVKNAGTLWCDSNFSSGLQSALSALF
jgi:hypothetical protein